MICFDKVITVLLSDMAAAGTSSSSTRGQADALSVVTALG
jgi:hypothetical protein